MGWRLVKQDVELAWVYVCMCLPRRNVHQASSFADLCSVSCAGVQTGVKRFSAYLAAT